MIARDDMDVQLTHHIADGCRVYFIRPVFGTHKPGEDSYLVHNCPQLFRRQIYQFMHIGVGHQDEPRPEQTFIHEQDIAFRCAQ